MHNLIKDTFYISILLLISDEKKNNNTRIFAHEKNISR